MKKRSVKDILTAKTENGQIIHLHQQYSLQELHALRENNSFACPHCGSKVVLKAGEIIIPHFAHKSHSDCDSLSEPESTLHLQGKLLLHQFFTAKNFTVELEKYLPSIRQRADLLVDDRTVIEFQCSTIPSVDVLRRTTGYTSAGFTPTWILGISKKPAECIQIVRLMEFQKEMLISRGGPKHLLQLNPQAGEFNYYSNLFHISGNRWVAKVQALPVAHQTFPFAVPKLLDRQDFENVCILFAQARASFIRSQLFAKNRYQNSFWLLCYKMGLDKHELPASIGVPIVGAECIAEHPVIWQLKTVHAFSQGMDIPDFLLSGKIRKNPKGTEGQLIKVLADYARFFEGIQGKTSVQKEQRNLLYHIYCKNVRKLRK